MSLVKVPYDFKVGIVDGFMTKEEAIDFGYQDSDIVEIVLL